MNIDDVKQALEKQGILIGEQIGEGGEAPVFRGQQTLRDGQTRKECAVKVYRFVEDVVKLPEDLNRQFEVLRQLDRSDHFVGLIDIIPDGRFIAIVMELGDDSLQNMLAAREGGFPRKECYIHLKHVAEGLSEAHGLPQPLYHGDVKPDNMLLCGRRVKLCDFGTAAIAPSRTTLISHGHTPEFLLPGHEGKLTRQRDFFAFAVSYALMRRGEFPFVNKGSVPDGHPVLDGLDPDEIELLRPVLTGDIPTLDIHRWYFLLDPERSAKGKDIETRLEHARLFLERCHQRRQEGGYEPDKRDFNDLEDAHHLVQECLNESPAHAAAHFLSAQICEEWAETLDAVDDADRQPDHGTEISSLFDEALVAIDKAISLRDDSAEYFAYRAELRINSHFGGSRQIPELYRPLTEIEQLAHSIRPPEMAYVPPDIFSAILNDTAQSLSLRTTPHQLARHAQLQMLQVITECAVDQCCFPERTAAPVYDTLDLRVGEAVNCIGKALDSVGTSDPVLQARLRILRSWINSGIELDATILHEHVRMGEAIADLDEAEQLLANINELNNGSSHGHDSRGVGPLLDHIRRLRSMYCLRHGLGIPFNAIEPMFSRFRSVDGGTLQHSTVSSALFAREVALWIVSCFPKAVSEALGRHQGEALVLDDLTELSMDVAQALAGHRRGGLYLNGLTELSAEVAQALVQYDGFLSLGGLRSLSVDVAETLVRQRRNSNAMMYEEAKNNTVDTQELLVFNLNGLTSLSVDVAKVVTNDSTTGYLYLNGLTSISVEVAETLGAAHVDFLSLNGLTSISVDVAEALAEYEGDLSLKGLVSPSPEVVEALGRHLGEG